MTAKPSFYYLHISPCIRTCLSWVSENMRVLAWWSELVLSNQSPSSTLLVLAFYSILQWTLFFFNKERIIFEYILFWWEGHSQLCPGLTPGSMLKDRSWQSSEVDTRQCWGWNWSPTCKTTALYTELTLSLSFTFVSWDTEQNSPILGSVSLLEVQQMCPAWVLFGIQQMCPAWVVLGVPKKNQTFRQG